MPHNNTKWNFSNIVIEGSHKFENILIYKYAT